MASTLVSAPGKVLVAGGYLVLDPSYSGIVVSTSSRFYTLIRQTKGHPNVIRITSPQFTDAVWEYGVNYNPIQSQTKNKFVHLALQHTLALGAEIKGLESITKSLKSGLDITIAGDNDFYSQRAKLQELGLPRTIDSLSHVPPFCSTGGSLKDVHKTGLGSSAALITSLTSSLLVHLSVIPESSLTDDDTEGRLLAHNLAQFVHCIAQGKIGSGFDISAAVFGSHLYTRFEPSVIQDLMAESTPSNLLLPVLTPSNTAWNYRVQPFKLPPYTRIMLADVDAGSDTPSLVGKVLKWRKEKKEEADALWTHLDQLNQSFAQTLLHLCKLHDQDPETYQEAVKYMATLQPLQWEANPWQPPKEIPIVAAFYEAHTTSQAIRQKMKEMGDLAGVPIEPDEQTHLLDVCVSQAGVIGGGVPGAGGYDAIWLLVCDPISCKPDQSPMERVEYLWSIYKELNVSPLSSKESLERGARLESVSNVKGLGDVLEVTQAN
ncbi:phosphomevalonate kinase [Panaeolus papilionaceus]|nr:phosphomevalonate kinase [Panaeolus papilionaceus]